MAKTKKKVQAVDAIAEDEPTTIQAVAPEAVAPEAVAPEAVAPMACLRDPLFELYLARVAKAETVNTMRRDGRAIFRDAFFEAKVALEVYRTMTDTER